MRAPTLYEIRTALEAALFEALTPAFQAGEVAIVQPGEDIAPELRKIQVIHNVNPGDIQRGEIDLRRGFAPRPGVHTVLLSCIDDVAAFARAWTLAGELERALRGRELAAGNGASVRIGEIDTTNIGRTPDNRLGLSLAVNWWAWAGGYEED